MTPTRPIELPRFEFAIPAGEAWRAARSAVGGLARTKIITDTDDYLHAECSSAFFGFVDDLELHLRPTDHLIAVRSAARLGHGDFGVNRKRVEGLRSALRQRGAFADAGFSIRCHAELRRCRMG